MRLRNVYVIHSVTLFLGLFAVVHTPAAERVVIIGCDGMSPDGIRKAETPHLDALTARGAHTLHARAVMPTSSSPNWASMIMGAGPEQHGVTSNDWRSNNFETAPTEKGPGGMFPTIFSVLRDQKPNAVIACFYDWGGFGRLLERDACDEIKHTPGPDKTTARAVSYIKAAKPHFLFVHLDHVDHVGHAVGHGTPEYYKAVEAADSYIGEIVAALSDAGMLDETVIIVSSDHGGRGKGHGGATMAELEIPWIIAGPGVKRGHEIKLPVDTYDTAATAAFVLGVTPPQAWIARPVLEAFINGGKG